MGELFADGGAQGTGSFAVNDTYRGHARHGRVIQVGLEFLEPDDPVRRSWESKWPQTGTAQNWDAVGRLTRGDSTEWILAEAKAHTGELISNCGAAPSQSNGTI